MGFWWFSLFLMDCMAVFGATVLLRIWSHISRFRAMSSSPASLSSEVAFSVEGRGSRQPEGSRLQSSGTAYQASHRRGTFPIASWTSFEAVLGGLEVARWWWGEETDKTNWTCGCRSASSPSTDCLFQVSEQ